jgi:polyhydroxyalkanoate synthesis repressor PhaR
MAGNEQVAATNGRRVIKRYSNRKLYDTKDSRYVTLQQIGEMVRQGEDVQIIDNKTKEDKTEVTLALILSEDLKNKPRSIPLGTLRTLVQERGERLLSSLREGPIGRFIPRVEDAAAPVEPEVPVEPPVRQAVQDDKPPRGRLNELVESSRQTLDQLQQMLDERVAAAVPGVSLIRELRSEIRSLTLRVEAIERRLGMTDGNDGDDVPDGRG